jgi:ABC-2 type transport system permease protein
MTRQATAAGAGQIFDLGYQPYEGPRQGRGRSLWAIYSYSLRTAFGIGRGGKAKIIPFTLLGLAIIPAAIALGIATLLGESLSPIRYSNYLETTSLIQTLFCATVAPELLCPDRRNRVLSLYFAHAITRLDYAVMKGAALLGALLVMALLPQVLLFLGNTLAAKDGFAYLRDNLDVLPRILTAGVLLSVYLAGLSLAVASLTPRRIFAAGGFIALFLISTATANVIWETFETQPSRAAMFFALGDLPFAATSWVFGVAYGSGSLAERTHLPGALLFAVTAAWAVLGLAVVVWRYLRWQP